MLAQHVAGGRIYGDSLEEDEGNSPGPKLDYRSIKIKRNKEESPDRSSV